MGNKSPAVKTDEFSRADSSAGFTDQHRIDWVRYLTIVGIAASLLIAPRLWLDDQFFGCVAIFGDWFRLVWPLDWIFLLAIGGLLIPAAVSPQPWFWVRIWCLLFFVRAVWDRMLWQPYLFQYFFMMVIVGFRGGSTWRFRNRTEAPTSDPAAALHAIRLIVVSIYVWSGVSKFNFMFLTHAVPQMFGVWLPDWVAGPLAENSWVIPLSEVLIAVGLLIPRLRLVAVAMAVLMHVSILVVIGPWGSGINHVVWPWNLVMIAVLPVIFWRSAVGPGQVLGVASSRIHRVIFLLFAIAPGLSYVGLWPHYVSFKLYSGTNAIAFVFVNERLLHELPADVRDHFELIDEEDYAGRLELDRWSLNRLRAFAPSEKMVFLHIARRFCRLAKDDSECRLLLVGMPDIRTGKRPTEVLQCGKF